MELRFLRTNGKPELDFFGNGEFAQFHTILDSEMKRLQVAGVGSVQIKAEPISESRKRGASLAEGLAGS